MHGQNSGMYLIRRTGLKWLCVITKRLVGDRMSSNQRAERAERCRVENEEDGTKT